MFDFITKLKIIARGNNFEMKKLYNNIELLQYRETQKDKNTLTFTISLSVIVICACGSKNFRLQYFYRCQRFFLCLLEFFLFFIFLLDRYNINDVVLKCIYIYVYLFVESNIQFHIQVNISFLSLAISNMSFQLYEFEYYKK